MNKNFSFFFINPESFIEKSIIMPPVPGER